MAVAAEGTQQSNKQQYDMLHPLFCRQVGRAPRRVGRACALPGPTLATPLLFPTQYNHIYSASTVSHPHSTYFDPIIMIQYVGAVSFATIHVVPPMAAR